MTRITKELVSRSARAKLRKDEAMESHLARITHVALNNKMISDMEGIAHVPIKSCTVLYLYDNVISRIEGLTQVPHLKDLYLQNNNIEEIGGLESNSELEALHLDNNCVSHLGGLVNNTQLHELHLNGQRLSEDVYFTFDIPTLEALSWSLVQLDISACHLADPRPLSILHNLRKLDMSNNEIEAGESMSDTLPLLQQLLELTAKGNPISRQQKYRQNTIVCCDRLEVLDGHEVSIKERQYLRHVKRRMAAMAQDAQVHEVNFDDGMVEEQELVLGAVPEESM